MVQAIYKPPQIVDEDELTALVVKYMTDYRRIYIEHPRVRYDGIYIAVCHYMYVPRLPMTLLPFIETDDWHATVVTASARTSG